ncbi:PREDICTED: membrane-associated guanylate kinase, WW and PDZ domain-containing protein 2-like isoform X2 [Priapulus caudatus]|uniref:Membrane-associated guanylate kinase, WW and PDZ domain-containing protein 2-like isoform X2 n=1 Tax=Priapulus caudatus TaxID=37621 RepID=A0ABM1EGG1_PRICU|nr:PREDICTED: membrane-associated guanylate kinase, WW and PDZ domain-containing protein 2-like isoform X2 [Priapulus caudatus]
MAKSTHKKKEVKSWAHRIREIVILPLQLIEENPPITVKGGADVGQFVWVADVKQDRLHYHSGKLHPDDLLLEVNEQKVPGLTQADTLNWIQLCITGKSPAIFKVVKPSGLLNKDLRQYLSISFPKGCMDHDQQQTIRENVYLRTVPCTTRPPRPEETHGQDYIFLSVDEFMALEKSGNLLESGIYDGNYYGTPRPPREPLSIVPNTASSVAKHSTPSTDIILPGKTPSSKGKRQRNRSSVEAIKYGQEAVPSGASIEMAGQPGGSNSPDWPSEEELGELPSNWERSYTETGEVYFIDHNTGTTHWLDPRHAKMRKKPEECDDQELPYGWEKVIDPTFGEYYIDHINRRTQYENPVQQAKTDSYQKSPSSSTLPRAKKTQGSDDEGAPPRRAQSVSAVNGPASPRVFFTRDPAELQGEMINTSLVKSSRGFGFTIVGGDEQNDEFLQIKNVVPDGPADIDGKLRTGDVLVYLDDHCVLGFTHTDVVSIFKTIAVNQSIHLMACRGYSLPFDPSDPNTEIVTTVAVTSSKSPADAGHRRVNGGAPLTPPTAAAPPEFLNMYIRKGEMGFGFTIADSAYGQKVKKIIDRARCRDLEEGDILVQIGSVDVRDGSHADVVHALKACPKNHESLIVVQRRLPAAAALTPATPPPNGFSTPKTDSLLEGAHGPGTPSRTHEARPGVRAAADDSGGKRGYAAAAAADEGRKQSEYGAGYAADDPQRLSSTATPTNDFNTRDFVPASYYTETPPRGSQQMSRSYELPPDQHPYSSSLSPHNPDYGIHGNGRQQSPGPSPSLNGQSGASSLYTTSPSHQPVHSTYFNSQSSYEHEPGPGGGGGSGSYEGRESCGDYDEYSVTLHRMETGFGFRIVGGVEEGSQVAVGTIVPGGAADIHGRLRMGDEILYVDGHSVAGASHHTVVQLMGNASNAGRVTVTVRRRKPDADVEVDYPYDVTVVRRDNEGFGFVIISSVVHHGSTIGRLIEGSPAERCGRLGLGDRILAVNGVNIVNLQHGDVVKLIKDSGLRVTLTVGAPLADDECHTSNMIQQPSPHQEAPPPMKPARSHSPASRSPPPPPPPPAAADQYHAVELRRGTRGFGFSIRGGAEFGNMPLFVLRIADSGPAHADGRIKVGDEIIEINSHNTKGMSHAQAIELIKQGGQLVRLLVRRTGVVPPALEQGLPSPLDARLSSQAGPLSHSSPNIAKGGSQDNYPQDASRGHHQQPMVEQFQQMNVGGGGDSGGHLPSSHTYPDAQGRMWLNDGSAYPRHDEPDSYPQYADAARYPHHPHADTDADHYPQRPYVQHGAADAAGRYRGQATDGSSQQAGDARSPPYRGQMGYVYNENLANEQRTHGRAPVRQSRPEQHGSPLDAPHDGYRHQVAHAYNGEQGGGTMQAEYAAPPYAHSGVDADFPPAHYQYRPTGRAVPSYGT